MIRMICNIIIIDSFALLASFGNLWVPAIQDHKYAKHPPVATHSPVPHLPQPPPSFVPLLPALISHAFADSMMS